MVDLEELGKTPLDHPAFEVHPVGGMTPFACTHYIGGRPFGITIYGTDEEQVIADNKDQLVGLRVEGILNASIPEHDIDCAREIVAYEERELECQS